MTRVHHLADKYSKMKEKRKKRIFTLDSSTLDSKLFVYVFTNEGARYRVRFSHRLSFHLFYCVSIRLYHHQEYCALCTSVPRHIMNGRAKKKKMPVKQVKIFKNKFRRIFTVDCVIREQLDDSNSNCTNIVPMKSKTYSIYLLFFLHSNKFFLVLSLALADWST